MKSATSLTPRSGSLSSSAYPWAHSSSSWPTSPGVYWFRGPDNRLLYVGKASNLKNRLKSYLKTDSRYPKTSKLVKLASSVKYKILSSPLQASLVESHLIKIHQPPFNILSKDDKSALYIVISTDKFPRVQTVRAKQLHTQYSNLPSSRIFGPFESSYTARQILKSARSVFKFCSAPPGINRACFYTHLNLCSGACTGQVSPTAYRNTIRSLRLFLQGKRNSLIRQLTRQMYQASKQHHFEQASVLRDQLQSLEYLFTLKKVNADPYLPILDSDLQADRLKQASYLLHQSGLVPLSYPLDRIEAYDISNTQGTLSTASMVVLTKGRPDPDQYRRFRIVGFDKANDPAMIASALSRRLRHQEWPLPQLILIDGGRTQLRSALSVVAGQIPTVSLVKHPDRLLLPFRSQIISIKLDPAHPAHSLFINARDQAHRFAKAYHSKLRRVHVFSDLS